MNFYSIVAVFAALSIPGSAVAADAVFLPDPIPAVSTTSAAHDWSGAYVGGSINMGKEGKSLPGVKTFKDGVVVGGVHGGYNFQTPENWVYGVEVDGNLAKASKSGTSLKKFGSARVRVGYAFDRILPYVDGGVALGRVSAGSESHTHKGYTVGAGLEYAVTDNLAARVSYHYLNFKERDYTINGTATSLGYKGHTVGTGISFKF